MAIFVNGMKCPLCYKVIIEEQDKVMIPALTGNPNNPLFIFSDAVVHKDCFYKHPLAISVEERLKGVYHNALRRHRVCEICNQEIKKPDEYFGTNLLSDQKESPLYQYNYMHFHRNCIKNWKRLDDFKKHIYEAKKNQLIEDSEFSYILKAIE